MPQETNLNVSPYYDDFEGNKNFYKVLFKPSYPVQARELTTLQSILQNQIEQFGSHLFKEGSQVIPGQLTYIKNFNCVQINEEFAGIPVSSYIDNLVGLIITGRTSGVSAKVVKVITSSQSEENSTTLYIDYINSSTNLNDSKFFDNEILEANKSIEITNNVSISVGEGFASTKTLNSTSIGSAFGITSGIYFIRGYFVQVLDDILILDQYTNNPSYRIGFSVKESIVNYYDDESLTDNATGFNNYAAPGADRLKIEVTLTKKDLSDFEDKNFIQLATIENGIIRDIKNKTEYSYLSNEFARRTYDESGDYYVKSFTVTLKDSLNNDFGNGGLFNLNEKTPIGSTPSSDLAVYKISPGKAYVKGYEVETVSPIFLDVLKPRTTKKIDSQAINFDFGPQLQVNRVYGFPYVGFNTTSVISLRDSRIGSNQSIAAGNEIGIARVYDFYLENGSYETSIPDQNVWELSLFDIQTYSVLTLNSNVTLSTPTYVRGEQSGSTGFLKDSVSNSDTITLYQIDGKFSEKEVIIFEGANGSDQEKRFVTNIVNYGISDIKSVYSNPGVGITFNADTIQKIKSNIGSATISPKVGTSSTITVTKNISGILNVGDILSYSSPGISTITYVKVSSVDTFKKEIIVDEIENVVGVNYSVLPSNSTTVSDLNVLETKLTKTEYTGNSADNESLFSVFPKLNIESVDLTQSQITIRKEFSVDITSNSTNTISAELNEVFLPFDEERYSLLRSDGSFERLTADKFTFIDGSTKIRIDNLGSNDTNCRLICTLRKIKVTSKTKLKRIVDSIIIDKSNNKSSGVGATTLNDGLIYGNYPFGTRVQDSQLCLNYPDIGIVYGIFESADANDPDCPVVSLSSIVGSTSTTDDLIIGEYFTGRTSKSKAVYIEKRSGVSIGFIYLSDTTFLTNEIIDFETSKVSSNIGQVISPSNNITSKYYLNTGQKKSFYDYSKLILGKNASAPTKKIKVFFTRSYYDVSDTGDITTKESYNSFDYVSEINSINGIRNTDILDLRPRVSNYTVTPGLRSPFEFDSRNFNNSSHSSKHVVSGSDSIILGYSYYLPRYDRIYLSKDGTFTVKSGTPSDDPKLPEEVSGSMNIANIYLPPYLYSTKDCRIEFVEHRRYQMRDIGLIDDRLKRVEKTTSLNLLESKTENLFIDDGAGLNRFKSGFFADNFTSLLTQNNSFGIKNSIDAKKGILRPSHYTTNIKLELATNGLTVDQNSDYRYSDIIGSNIKRSGDIISLDYSDISWLRQPFATRTENVTPYFVTLYEGSIELNPTVDVWINTTVIEPNNVIMEGSFMGVAESLRAEITDSADGSRLGISPVIWNSWETSGIDVNLRTETLTSSSTSSFSSTGNRRGTASEFQRFTGQNAADFGGVPTTFLVGTQTSGTTTTTTTTTNEYLGVTLSQERSGTQYTVTEEINTESLGERIVSREIINYMRARNIEFTARRMKPFTEVYPFFDGVNVSEYCFNKLIQIQMISGSFEVGETVLAISPSELNSSYNDVNWINSAVFRIARPNHKYGPYNNPTDFYDRNPFDRDNNIPSEYSTSSNILNIDTYSLSEEVNSGFYGNVKNGMILRGINSGSEARVINSSLITDRVGTLIGSFRVPEASIGETPKFETGRSRFRLTNSSINSQIPGVITTVAEETFYSQGDSDISQATTLSLRNARVDVNTNFNQTRSLSDEALIDSTTTTSTTTNSNTRLTGEYRDPLAQSFIVDDDTGIFVTKVDLYFRTKDESLPVTVQIREMELGIPSQKILPFSEVELTPDKINLSEDASNPTSFIFQSPVYLEGQREYAIIVISNSNEYNVWISRLGEPDVATLATEQGQILVTTQRLLGSLFKSQNASSWTPSQYEDLTFQLYRAEFERTGYAQFVNPNLPSSLEIMKKDPLQIESNKIRVSLSSTIFDSNDIDFGTKIIQEPTGLSTASGIVIGYGGSATQNLQIVNSGIGYTPSSGIHTFNNVSLSNISGSGVNATANITVTDGVVTLATIVSGGSGYSIGDILEPSNMGNNVGVGARLYVSKIYGNNQFILDNVQGNFVESNSYPIKYLNSSNSIQSLNGTDTYINSPIDTITDGNHIKVFHRNHGMHSTVNYVTLKDIESDIKPVRLTSDYTSLLNADIPIENTIEFTTYENAEVSPLNPGYVKIGSEIIKYTGYTATSLTGIERDIDNTGSYTHFKDNLVYKYELGGISLRRINKTHNLLDSDQIIDDNNQSTYYIKVDTEEKIDLKFNQTKEVGGTNGKATYNIAYNAVHPDFRTIAPIGSFLNYELNTITGTTINGNEISFVNAGSSNIENNNINYFDSPRLVASKINEDQFLSDIPFNKSLLLSTYFRTLDSRVSPCIDLTRTNLLLISNIINNIQLNYAEDPRVNTIENDPHLFSYVTNKITLENPSSGIKVILDAYVNTMSDIRVFYSIGDSDIFIPFPGSAVDLTLSDGSSDIFVRKNDHNVSDPAFGEFNEYEYTIDNLSSFKTFSIKIVATSSNSSFVPMIRNLRAIALGSI